MHHDSPAGRYDDQGDFYLDLPESLVGSPLVVAFLLVLERNFPERLIDCDGPYPLVTTVWASWQHAQRAEAIGRLFWPDLRVEHASANPAYRAVPSVLSQLAAAKRALDEAEATVRCAQTLPRAYGDRAAAIMAGRR